MPKLRDDEQIKKLFKTVFDTPEGRDVLTHLRAMSFMDTHCFVAGDPYATCFNEGKRSIVAYVLSLLKDKPKLQEVANDE